jgi:hypothetical protein
VYVSLAALCSAVGQVFIFYSSKHMQFSNLIVTKFTSIRTLLSIPLSAYMFGHGLGGGQTVGVAVVAVGLLIGLPATAAT